MSFYCARCARDLGHRPTAPSTNFLLTQYQRDKHQKHTTPGSTNAFVSVFDDGSEKYYQETIEEAYRRGAVEVTNRGTDVLFCGSTQSSIGFLERWGLRVARQDTVRVVKSDDGLKVHAFLNHSADHSGYLCSNCSGAIFATT